MGHQGAWAKRRGCAGEAPECARAPQEKKSTRGLVLAQFPSRTATATGTAVTPPPPANTQEATPDLRPPYAHSNAAPHPRSNLTSDLNTSRLSIAFDSQHAHLEPIHPQQHPKLIQLSPHTATPNTSPTKAATPTPRPFEHGNASFYLLTTVHRRSHSNTSFKLPSRRQPILNSLQAHTRATTHPTIAFAPPPSHAWPSVSRS